MFVFAASLNASFGSWVSQFPLDLQCFRQDEKEEPVSLHVGLLSLKCKREGS